MLLLDNISMALHYFNECSSGKNYFRMRAISVQHSATIA
jgi:hypothetical protein